MNGAKVFGMSLMPRLTALLAVPALVLGLTGPAGAQGSLQQRLAEATRLTCPFTLVATATWKSGAPAADVTPATLNRVRASGDLSGARILERILDDEIRHVAVGARHFHDVCHTRDEAPCKLWQNLVKTHFRGALKPPFNDSARFAAGLPRDWYAAVA